MGVLESLVGRSTTFAAGQRGLGGAGQRRCADDGTEWLTQQLQLCARLGHTPQQAAETIADAAADGPGKNRMTSP